MTASQTGEGWVVLVHTTSNAAWSNLALSGLFVEMLERIVAAIEANDAQCLITADHGNVEKMQDPQSGQPHTAHTCEPVPLVYVGGERVELHDGGSLSDVVPTLITLMGLPVPSEMTGRPLIDPSVVRARA